MSLLVSGGPSYGPMVKKRERQCMCGGGKSWVGDGGVVGISDVEV